VVLGEEGAGLEEAVIGFGGFQDFGGDGHGRRMILKNGNLQRFYR
jgi:hypothetical protein